MAGLDVLNTALRLGGKVSRLPLDAEVRCIGRGRGIIVGRVTAVMLRNGGCGLRLSGGGGIFYLNSSKVVEVLSLPKDFGGDVMSLLE